MSDWRWLAVLPSAGGIVMCLAMLSAGTAAPALASDYEGVTVDSYSAMAIPPDQGNPARTSDLALRMRAERQQHRLAVRKEAARDRRQEAAQDARQAAAAAARAAAAAAAQKAATPVASSPPASNSQTVSVGATGFEACVISHESGGNPTIVNASSGAGGLFQFLLSTWDGLGMGYPGGAQTAPVSVQVAAFWKLYDEAGTAPWAGDGCA